jgi:polar amino acid transport system substrate-binding protein
MVFVSRLYKTMLGLCSLSCSLFIYAQTPPLKVVTELSPPEQTLINGEVAGVATDKVKVILQKANLRANIEIYPWARAYNKAVSEPNTLIYSIAKTEKREPLFYWLMPVTHYKLGWVSLRQRTDIDINKSEDAKQYRIVVQRDDIAHLWLLNNGFIEGQHFITCSDIDCSWQLLINKNVDLLIETPDFIEDMLQHFHLPIDSAKYISSIPDLEIIGYLAANKHIDPKILEKLKQAIDTP